MNTLSKSFVTGTLALVLFTSFTANVQAVAGKWSANGNTIYYNDGNLGIGTSSPRGRLDIVGDPIFGRAGGSALMIQTPASDVRLVTSKNLTIPTGSVGIGTLTPQAKLDVMGDVFFSRIGGSGLYIQTPSSDVRLFSAVGKPILFPVGNIGIGTYNPTKKLSVNGTILAKEILVSSAASNWPDYVFEEGYDLMSLEEIESFIEANKHLPNIPSQDDVEKDGVSLGEMQRLHMEKIEELTLHMIEKDKEIRDLKGENDELLKRLERLESILLNN